MQSNKLQKGTSGASSSSDRAEQESLLIGELPDAQSEMRWAPAGDADFREIPMPAAANIM